MSFRLFKEDTITPSTRSINVRNYLDSDGPHKITFGVRTVVADPAAGTLSMYVLYETPNGELRTIELQAPADLKVITDAGGAMWYAPSVLVIDKHYPLADGPNANNPYGFFSLEFFLGGSAGSAKISYEAIVDVFDGTPAVVTIP